MTQGEINLVVGRHAAPTPFARCKIVSAGLDLFALLSLFDKLGVFHGETCERIDEDVGDIGRYISGRQESGLAW
jgi:hypothetical protein